MFGKSLEITQALREDDSARGLGHRNNDGVDRGSSARPGAQARGTASSVLPDRLHDTHCEKPFLEDVSPWIAAKSLHEHDRRDDCWPEPGRP